MSDRSLITFEGGILTLCMHSAVSIIVNKTKGDCLIERLSYGRKREMLEKDLSNQDLSGLFSEPFTVEELIEINVVEYYKAFLSKFPPQLLEYTDVEDHKIYNFIEICHVLQACPNLVTAEIADKLYNTESRIVRGLLCELVPNMCPCKFHSHFNKKS